MDCDHHLGHPRRVILGFLRRNNAIAVCKAWCDTRTPQTTRVKCSGISSSSSITDAHLNFLTGRSPHLAYVDLRGCCNLSDAAVVTLATRCRCITYINLRYD